MSFDSSGGKRKGDEDKQDKTTKQKSKVSGRSRTRRKFNSRFAMMRAKLRGSYVKPKSATERASIQQSFVGILNGELASTKYLATHGLVMCVGLAIWSDGVGLVAHLDSDHMAYDASNKQSDSEYKEQIKPYVKGALNSFSEKCGEPIGSMDEYKIYIVHPKTRATSNQATLARAIEGVLADEKLEHDTVNFEDFVLSLSDGSVKGYDESRLEVEEVVEEGSCVSKTVLAHPKGLDYFLLKAQKMTPAALPADADEAKALMAAIQTLIKGIDKSKLVALTSKERTLVEFSENLLLEYPYVPLGEVLSGIDVGAAEEVIGELVEGQTALLLTGQKKSLAEHKSSSSSSTGMMMGRLLDASATAPKPTVVDALVDEHDKVEEVAITVTEATPLLTASSRVIPAPEAPEQIEEDNTETADSCWKRFCRIC